MKIRIFVLTVIAIVMALAAIPPAHSCSCVPPPPPAQAFEGAAAVLMGKVVSIDDGPGPYLVTATLQVSRIWKGEKIFLQKILTTRDLGAMCGFYFQVGKSYVIYAYKNQDGQLETNNCTRSASTDRAAADLMYLSSLSSAANDSACCGSKNIFAGDLYLFLGMIFYLLRRKSKQVNNSIVIRESK